MTILTAIAGMIKWFIFAIGSDSGICFFRAVIGALKWGLWALGMAISGIFSLIR